MIPRSALEDICMLNFHPEEDTIPESQVWEVLVLSTERRLRANDPSLTVVDWSPAHLKHKECGLGQFDNNAVNRLAEALVGNTVCHTVDIRSDTTRQTAFYPLPPSVSVSVRAIEESLICSENKYHVGEKLELTDGSACVRPCAQIVQWPQRGDQSEPTAGGGGNVQQHIRAKCVWH